MPYSPCYYRPPTIYLETQARRQRDLAHAHERRMRADQKRIADAIDEHGDNMSDEGKGLLLGIAETLKVMAGAMRGQR